MSQKKDQKLLKQRGKEMEKRKIAQTQLEKLMRSVFHGSFVQEYQRISEQAPLNHPMLLGVFECDDDLFYEQSLNRRLAHFGFGQFQQVLLDVVGSLDFEADPTVRDGTLNEHRPKPTGVSVTGSTAVVTDGNSRKVVVFMRAATGDSGSPEAMAGVKLTALLHELGHVTDIEQGVNYRSSEIDIVAAEVFAHHYACNELIRGKYRLSLGYYLASIEESVNSPSEYVRVAAKAVIESPDWPKYKAAVSLFYNLHA